MTDTINTITLSWIPRSMPSSAEKASQESMLQQEIKAMSERQRRK